MKLIGVMGSGLIGTNPYEENAWSGSSRYFFEECRRQGILHRAFGVEVENVYRFPLILSNFSFNRDLWRHKFYLDTRYYEFLSTRIVGGLTPQDENYALLQIGGIYNLKPLLNAAGPVFSYHDGNLAQAIRNPNFPRKLSRSHVQRAFDYEKRVYQNVDMIFTMSEYLRESFLNDFGIEDRKVKTIGAGINLDSVPEVLKKDYDNENLLFIGADFERKGGMVLLRAFRKVRSVCPAAKLHIVGPRKLAIPSDLSHGVVYQGFLSKNDPIEKRMFAKIMNDSSLFVMPSLYEPFGIAPLEAMAYQIPVILTDGWAFPEMVQPGFNGELVRFGDADDLAEKIISLLKKPSLLETMGKAGRELVLKRFTWQNVVDNLRHELSVSGIYNS
ncbi:MAG: glycosyltransferase family 4 protein [Gammaproteobacteria bacterium]|nr:glycosyltransferase family 4 protein [Gammaproteobacteria bacterium]